MNRDRQIELIKSAEERTRGYFKAWMAVPRFAAAILSPNPHRPMVSHSQTMRKRACG